MRPFLSLACATLLLVNGASAFSCLSTPRRESSIALSMSADSRRSFLSRVATTSAAVAAGLATGSTGISLPANAIGGGLNKVNAKLRSFGLPPFGKLPDGFTPLAEIYGKGKNRFPLLVQFAHPSDWVVVLPNNDVNGEDGTIQAGEYAKGDTATFYVYTAPGKVQDIASKNKQFFQDAIIAAISQKGNNVYQNFKVTNVEPRKVNDQDYVLVDFKYELLTGAGFEVDRTGVASVTSVGDGVEVLWCASTRQRYKKTEPILRNIANSFRCFAEGLNFADELITDSM